MSVKILIVKLSSLGDVVHAMPAVQDIRHAFPGAEIDWVVEGGFAPLVRRCAGVNRVIECQLRQWRKAPFSRATRQAWQTFKAALQLTQYDAVIDLQGLSKSALVSRLARVSDEGNKGHRFALANRTEGSSYEAPTRWVADVAIRVTAHSHAVRRSRELCAKALGYGFDPQAPGPEVFGLLSSVSTPKLAINNIAIDRFPDGPAVVALVHGTSRADKLWPEDEWVELAWRLMDAGLGIALPHGNDEERERSERMAQALATEAPGAPPVQVWPRLGLDALTDALAQTAGVIGVDSGLSHIAVALDLPHVQLYNFDTAWRTGPSGVGARQRSVFAMPHPSLEQVWQAWLAVSAPGLGVSAPALEVSAPGLGTSSSIP